MTLTQYCKASVIHPINSLYVGLKSLKMTQYDSVAKYELCWTLCVCVTVFTSTIELGQAISTD